MQAQKISISLPNSMCDFIDHYQEAHNCKSRSDVVNQALYLLQQTQLEACYKEANKEVDEGLEVTVFDGLEDETW